MRPNLASMNELFWLRAVEKLQTRMLRRILPDRKAFGLERNE
jgi:hypothetical protein